MMNKIIKSLSGFISLLDLYPMWAKVAIAILFAIIILILFLAPRKNPPPQEPKIRVSIEPTEPPKDSLEINISPGKILSLKNNGNVSLENIQLFATRYLLNKKSFNEDKIEIENFNKIGGAIHTVPILAPGKEENIDLTKKQFLQFFENPGKEDYTPILTYFCLRITYESPITKKKIVFYKTTSSIKDFPSWVDNQEHTAYTGGTSHDFIFDIPEIIERHQKKIYNDK